MSGGGSGGSEERRPWQPWMRPRWARISQDRVLVCRDEHHAAFDYVFVEPNTAGQLVRKVACGICFPKATNPGAER